MTCCRVSGRDSKGGAVGLTLNDAAQKAAYSGLSGKVGSVTALDPSTGAILAMASAPSYDPNLLSTHDLQASQKAYEKLEADPNKPLLNRPLVSTPPPGSTFKLVTTAAALESGRFTPSTVVPGARLGADKLRVQAEKFGFNKSFTVPMRSAASRYPTGLDAAQTAMSAIGQFDVTASTLQMAMVGAAIGNNGITMNPYLVKEIRGADLQIVQTASPSQFATAMSPTNAKAELNMMVDVVENGTGSNAQIGGIKVGGKTGTAETGPGRPAVAWFVAVAPADNPKVAVAVCIENAGGKSEISGNGLGAPIAKSVIEAVLNNQ